MCRLVAYLGSTVSLAKILSTHEHSLIVQSYQPREMTSGVVNADGFGVGWYHPQKSTNPFTYRNTLPIWNDPNLPSLSRYVESGCILAYVRSATPGQALEFANCQPFHHGQNLFIHNGYIENFRQTLHRQIRCMLSDDLYGKINGSTDSEHIFAWLLSQLEVRESEGREYVLRDVLISLLKMANTQEIKASANIIFTDGYRLIASRFATNAPAPSLYWLRDDLIFPKSIIIASEPLFTGNWISCPENSIISVGEDYEPEILPI